jgi:hypothetical protein
MELLPTISRESLTQASEEDTWTYLFLFIDQYGEMMANDATGELMQHFNPEQHTLMAFNALCGEVNNGGFLQLIQNGYGGYIFDSPFSESLRNWGAERIADIVDRARLIFEADREVLEQETTLEGFAERYHTFRDFEPLEALFYAIADEEADIVKNYVSTHLAHFAQVTD